MKTSEMAERLNKIISETGDIELLLEDADTGSTYSLDPPEVKDGKAIISVEIDSSGVL